MKHFIFFILALFVSTAILTAEEPAQTATQPESPTVPIFKDGEKIYLSVESNDPRTVIYLSSVGKDEFNNKGFLKDAGYGDYLVPYNGGIDIRIWSRAGSNHEVMRINTKELLDDLQKQIKESPNDKTKWETVSENGEVKFTFAGIQRFYELQSIRIPDGSKHRKHRQYERGQAPGLRLRIDKNGKYVGYIQSRNKAWESDFPSGQANRIEVKEGMDERFVLRLRDWNVSMFGGEHPIVDFSGTTLADFKRGSIVEKLGDLDDAKSAIELKFRPVTP